MGKYSTDGALASIDQSNIFGDDRISGGKWATLAFSLGDLLSADHDPLTLSIEAFWGSGKTFFLRRLESQLRERFKIGVKGKFKIITLNAWESDYATDPLVAIINQLQKAFPKEMDKPGIKESVGNILKLLAAKGLDAVTTITTAGVVDMNTIELLDKRPPEKQFDLSLRQFREFEEGKRNFSTALEKYLGETDQTGIIIIDELDRCHPHFAIELLERIKHFFPISRLKFVFGIDHDQLCQLVKGAYSPDLDAYNYLNRFFNLRIALPIELDSSDIEGLVRQRFQAIIGQDEKGQPLVAPSVIGICGVFRCVDLSFRQILLIVNRLALAFRYVERIRGEMMQMTLGLCINELDQKLFAKITSGAESEDDLFRDIVRFFMGKTHPDAAPHKSNLDSEYIPYFLCLVFDCEWLANNRDTLTKAEYLDPRLGIHPRLDRWFNVLRDSVRYKTKPQRALFKNAR